MTALPAPDRIRLPGPLRHPPGAHRGGRGRRRPAPRSAVRSLDRRGDPFRGVVRALIPGPPGFERTVAFAATKRPSASHAPPRAGAWAPPRGKDGRLRGKPRLQRRRRWYPRRKRRLIPEGRARIIAATKRRWAALRRAKAAGNPGAPEKATPAAAKPGLRRIGAKSAAKNSKPAVAPPKALGRTKAAPRRPGRGEGAKRPAAPAMAEAAAAGAPAAAAGWCGRRDCASHNAASGQFPSGRLYARSRLVNPAPLIAGNRRRRIHLGFRARPFSGHNGRNYDLIELNLDRACHRPPAWMSTVVQYDYTHTHRYCIQSCSHIDCL